MKAGEPRRLEYRFKYHPNETKRRKQPIAPNTPQTQRVRKATKLMQSDRREDNAEKHQKSTVALVRMYMRHIVSNS